MRSVTNDRGPSSTLRPALPQRTQGWSEAEVRAQVLTPLEESSLRGTVPDPRSIMCYQIPGSLTKDGQPIIGGADIDRLDGEFAAQIYPKKTSPASSKPKGARRRAA